MRLTLRTMLAYLDDVLDPADAIELGKKIEESKFASELVHRIRTSVRRLRLDAPKLDGKGMGLDPNTVAEYLDNNLPADRVPDFEKVCVESDRHLAEVASCHQILMLVVGGPAQVEPVLRDRIYAIPAATEESVEPVRTSRTEQNGSKRDTHSVEPPPPPKGASTAMSADTTDGRPTRAQPEISDYLRVTSRSRIGPIITVVAIAFLGVVVVLRTLGPFDRTHPIAGWFGVAPVQVAENSNASAPDSSAGGEAPMANTAQTKRRPADEADGTTPSGKPEDQAPEPRPADDREPKRADDKRLAVTPPPADEPADEPTAAKPGDAPQVAAVPREANGKRTPAVEPTAGARFKANPTTELKPIEPSEVDVGRFKSDEQVVAHVNTKSGLWKRLPRGTTLVSGDQLIVLPIYRPIVSLSTGVHLMFVGESLVTFQSSDTMDGPQVAINYGRAVISTSGRPGAQVHLRLGDQDGVATFSDMDAELAVEVRKYLPPGSDPEVTPAWTIVQIFSTTGRIDWQPRDGESEKIPLGHVRVSITGQSPHVAKVDGSLAWLEAKSVSKIDRDAAQELEGFLAADKSLSLLLEERMQYRKTEVRSLAARCLGALGEFEALLGEVGDERQYSYWMPAVDALRESLAHSPDSAAKLRATLERERGPDARVLYRLLWEYSPEQLEKGGAKELVSFLEHGSLDVRVLAFETLRRITSSNHNYRPEVSADRRRIPVKTWQDRLKEGRIVYKTAPSPFPERKAALKPAKEEPAKGGLPEAK